MTTRMLPTLVIGAVRRADLMGRLERFVLVAGGYSGKLRGLTE